MYKSLDRYLRPRKGRGESEGKTSSSSSVSYVTGVIQILAQTVKKYTHHLAHIKLY